MSAFVQNYQYFLKQGCGLLVLAVFLSAAVAQEVEEADGFSPQPLAADQFADLKERSPFLRTLDFADTYLLRGVATIDGQPVAVLINRHTEKTVQVTAQQANELGMRLVGVDQATDLSKVAVRLVIGGEEVELAYGEAQISPQGRPQAKPRYDSKGRLQPPPSLVDKYRSMNREQMGQYQRWRSAYLKKYPDQAHSPKRYQLGEKVVDAIKAGKGPPAVK